MSKLNVHRLRPPWHPRVAYCSKMMATSRLRSISLLLGILAASFVSVVFGLAPSRMLRVEGPPARYQACKKTYGPWPATIPTGSNPAGFSDGQHANMSQFVLSFTDKGIKGIKTEWVDFLVANKSIPSYTTFSHGTVTGRKKATFKWQVGNPDNTPFMQVKGTYTKAGLDSLTFVDSNQNTYEWGQIDPIPGVARTSFSSPVNKGFIVGFFGANSKTALTQIGVCVSKA